MAEVRVQLPLGALDQQDVGKPGIPRASGARDRGFKSRRPDFRLRWGPCWYGQAPVKRHVAGSIPATAALRYGRSSQLAMAAAVESGRAMSLEGSTPSPSAFACPWPIGRGASLPSWRGGFDSRRALLNDDRGSASGRPPGFEPGDGGSTPPPRTCCERAVSRWTTRCGVI